MFYTHLRACKRTCWPRYCGPHCGPSAAVKSFKRATWGYFSAACFLHGRALLRETGRPQGMLESCWGGTPIQAWSSQAALGQCNGTNNAMENVGAGVTDSAGMEEYRGLRGAASTLWAGMIAPLLKLPIKGAIWYQGKCLSCPC